MSEHPHLDHRENELEVLDARSHLHNVAEAADLGRFKTGRLPPCAMEDAELSCNVLSPCSQLSLVVVMQLPFVMHYEPWHSEGHTTKSGLQPSNLCIHQPHHWRMSHLAGNRITREFE